MSERAAFPRRTSIVTAAAAKDLTILATFKTRLGITTSTDDALHNTLIHEASAAICKHCRREFARETLLDRYRAPHATDVLYLSRRPVAAIDSIVEDGVTLVAADYELDAKVGRLWRLDASGDPIYWTGQRPISVQHQSGWTLLEELPSDIENACIEMVKFLWYSRSGDPRLRSESIPGLGDIGYALPGASGGMGMTRGLPDTVAGLLTDYIDPALP